ncbi:LOW QUALITY PROTEIN: cathepsin L-like [Babylonia areolata]|uniref:LOW QUALITY PROTEIN: cathepsin L-like n=1 Tax=Babylonia areolata TaxID=304850 RepID=UPI003FD5F72A
MKNFLFLYLLPLGALGALLGGYKPLDVDDPVVQSKLRPVLESNGQLGSLPIRKVEQQRLFRVTNYRVYQGIPNRSLLQLTQEVRLCAKITCHDEGGCDPATPCSPHAPHTPPAIHTPGERPRARPRVKPHLLGGEEAASGDEVQEAMMFAVEKLNGMSNALFRMVPEDVSNVTKQVVSGMMYRFTVSMVTTQCRNSPANKGKLLAECTPSDDAQMQQCRVAVWWKLNGEYSLESQQCGKMQPHPQSHLLGGDGHDNCHVHLKAFRKFKDDFGKLYSSAKEEAYRFSTFCSNMKRIKTLQKTETGSAVYGVNKFADISEDEFRKLYLTPKWDLMTPRPWMTPAAHVKGDDVPDRFDWRKHGAVTPVKNQGSCGSCWAFSTTGNVEGQLAIKHGKLLSLSEQELVDCDKMDDGCEGGLPANAYQAIMKLGGLETEKEYSYQGADEKCRFNRSDVVVKVKGGLNISSNEEEMKGWLYKNGPISIGINAFAMQFYFGGISHPWKLFCNPDSLDHGVLIVGYDVSSSGEPYWIVKNSWGPDWGEEGYYLVFRGAGVCGLNRMCTSAVVN